MKSLLIPASVVLGAILLFSQNQAPQEVEITSEPSHHLALENSYVRVFQVEVAPHSATLMHRHRHDYMFVTLGASEISNEVEGQPPVRLKLPDGETRFLPGNFAHIARNLSNDPFRNVTIEFLQDKKPRTSPPHKWNEERGLRVLHGGTEDILFAKDGVRASAVDLQVAGVEPQHRHAWPQLLVAVTDLDLRNDIPGKPFSNLEMKSGDVKWFGSEFTHTVTNVGREGAKFVIVEFQ